MIDPKAISPPLLIVAVWLQFVAQGDAALGDENWDAEFNRGVRLNGTVCAIATDGNDLYVGGAFTTVGMVSNINHIAKWDGKNWSALGTGVSGSVLAIAISDSKEVYVGGWFTQAGGWFTKTWWRTGPGPLFSAGGANAHYVAKWGGKEWTALAACRTYLATFLNCCPGVVSVRYASTTRQH